MSRPLLLLCLSILILITTASSSSAPLYQHPARILTGLCSNAVSELIKWIWSLKTSTKTAASSRPLMKFESGYNVETVFDGSKIGVEPHAVEMLPNGELLILDSENSNIHKISSSLSLYSRPKLLAGSAEGYSGHVDGRLRESKLNNSKGIAVDDKGNIYVADVDNMAIRRISDTGVTTIAGGKWGRSGEHVDGPSEDAKFSDDFDVVYAGSSCSLLVIDRGNKAIREIQLHSDNCTNQYESDLPLGVAVLVAACFFGYMLALLQRRVSSIFSSHTKVPTQTNYPASPYQKPFKSVRPPLIPTEDNIEKQEDDISDSFAKFTKGLLVGLIPGSRKKPRNDDYTSHHIYPQQQQKPWPPQDSFVIPREDEPPSIDSMDPTRKTYPFMSKDSEKMHRIRQSRVFYRGMESEQRHLQQRHQHHSSRPHTVVEQSWDNTEEIVFGAIQEQEAKRKPVVIKPLNYERSVYDHAGTPYHYNYNGYGYGSYT